MPTGPLETVPLIVDTVTAMHPAAVVDLGMGTGKYGFLIRERLDLAPGTHGLRLVGVEGFSGYIGAHQHAVYDEIVEADVLDYLAGTDEIFDVGIALDIIEHFAPGDAVTFMRAALRRCGVVIVSTPRSFYPQTEHGNTLELHRSWWTRRELRRLAAEVGVDVKLRRLRFTHVAMFGTAPLPRFADERMLAARNQLRDTLIPESVYCRLRGKSGPTLLRQKSSASWYLQRAFDPATGKAEADHCLLMADFASRREARIREWRQNSRLHKILVRVGLRDPIVDHEVWASKPTLVTTDQNGRHRFS